MASPAEKRATYEDLRALPEHLVGQIVDGELIALPRPALAHALVATNLTSEINPPFGRGRGGPGGWWILMEPELHLDADVLVPDLASWRRDRVPALPDDPFFSVAPDWVCEILSPRTAGLDRVRKMRIYAREGVTHAWLVDPDARTLEAFRRHGREWLRIGSFADDEQARIEPFEAVAIELAALWLTPAKSPYELGSSPSPEPPRPRSVPTRPRTKRKPRR